MRRPFLRLELDPMNFADRLKQLPSAAHLTSLQVLDAGGHVVATLENKPGQAGSLALYAALAALYGGHITPAATAWAWSGTPSTRPTPTPTPPSTPTLTDWCSGPRAAPATKCACRLRPEPGRCAPALAQQRFFAILLIAASAYSPCPGTIFSSNSVTLGTLLFRNAP